MKQLKNKWKRGEKEVKNGDKDENRWRSEKSEKSAKSEKGSTN